MGRHENKEKHLFYFSLRIIFPIIIQSKMELNLNFKCFNGIMKFQICHLYHRILVSGRKKICSCAVIKYIYHERLAIMLC
jgi:hypothetical protein